MEIKRPSHICAGAVFEFAAIFWNLFEKFLQKASFTKLRSSTGIQRCHCLFQNILLRRCRLASIAAAVHLQFSLLGTNFDLAGLCSQSGWSHCPQLFLALLHGTLALFPEAIRRMFPQSFCTVTHDAGAPSWVKAYLHCATQVVCLEHFKNCHVFTSAVLWRFDFAENICGCFMGRPCAMGATNTAAAVLSFSCACKDMHEIY
ncbi:MAG: hypothetical protein ACLU4P_00105 [Ruminococcus sp.]